MMVVMAMAMPLCFPVIVIGMPGRGFVAVAATTTTMKGFMVIVFFFMCAMAYAAAVFFVFLCVVFSTSAHAFFFFFHNRLVLFFCKVTDTFLQLGCKGGKGYCGGQARAENPTKSCP